MHLGKTTIVWVGLLAASFAYADRQSGNDDGYGGAKKAADQGNQNMLQPQMMQHLAKAADHMQKAQQAQQQQNFGQADSERKMAAMEQQQAKQLGDQMKANNDSAKQNKDGQDKTRDESNTNANPLAANLNNSGRPARESADYQRASTTVGSTPNSFTADATTAPAEETPRLPPEQLANLTAAAMPIPVRVVATSETAAGDATGAVQTRPDTSLTMISTPKNDSAESAPAIGAVGGPAGSSGSASFAASATTATVSTLDTGLAGATVNDRLLASAKPVTALDKESDFWKNARNDETSTDSTDAPTPERALKGAPAADNTPGRKLSDSAFWKRAGGEPTSCRISGRRTDAKKRGHDRCLREARKKLERKWREKKLARR